MGKETSKGTQRRLHDLRYGSRYFVGVGIDIGAGNDPLSQYSEFFPLLERVVDWDKAQGNAQLMEGVSNSTYDFLYSSHCLEHLGDPAEALRNWIRVVKPNGHLIIVVPDEDLYEQGEFPSYNRTHKTTFTICKAASWSSVSVNLTDLVGSMLPQVEILKMELLDSTFRFGLGKCDQTKSLVGECGIEIILRKRDGSEVDKVKKIRELNE